jgi:DNA-binding protein HU-beta
VNKAELIEKIATKTQTTKTQAEAIFDAALSIITDTVSCGNEVKIVGFGSFSKISRKSRKGRNPKTGETVIIPESHVPKFKPGKDFRDILNS